MIGSAPHQHVHPVSERGVEAGASGDRLLGDGVGRVTVADVGVGGRRGGMGQLCGGDGPHRLARRLGQLEYGRHRGAVVAGAVVDALVAVDVLGRSDGLGVAAHGDHLVVHLDPCGVGRHRGGRVRGLGVVGEGLDAGAAWQLHHLEIPLFPHLVEAGGGEHAGAHAVADKENDVLGVAGLGLGQAAEGGEQGGAHQGFVHGFSHGNDPHSLAAALTLPKTAVLSSEPWKLSAPWPMAPRKTSVPPWVSLPSSPTLTTTSW